MINPPYPQPPPDRHGYWTVRAWFEGAGGLSDPFVALVSDRRGFCAGYYEGKRNNHAPRAYWTLLCAPDGTVKQAMPPTPPTKPNPLGDPIAWMHMDQVTVRLKLGGEYREATTPASVYGLPDALAVAARSCLDQETKTP